MGRLAAPVAKAQRAVKGRGSGSAPGLQAQLSINPPGDRFEQEADRIASQVTRATAQAVPPPFISRVDQMAQRAIIPAVATIESADQPKEPEREAEPGRARAQRAPLQRAAATGKRDDKLQRRAAKPEDKVQRAQAGGASLRVPADIEQRLEGMRDS